MFFYLFYTEYSLGLFSSSRRLKLTVRKIWIAGCLQNRAESTKSLLLSSYHISIYYSFQLFIRAFAMASLISDCWIPAFCACFFTSIINDPNLSRESDEIDLNINLAIK